MKKTIKVIPKKQEDFFFVDEFGDVEMKTMGDSKYTKKQIKFGNYFNTKEEAERVRDKFFKLCNK